MVTETTLPPGYSTEEFIDGDRRSISLYAGDRFLGWVDALPSGQFIACLSNSVVADEATALQRLVAAAQALSGEEQ